MGGSTFSLVVHLATVTRGGLLCVGIGFLILTIPLTLPVALMGLMMLSDTRAQRRKQLGSEKLRKRPVASRAIFWACVFAASIVVIVVASWLWQRLPQGRYEILMEGLSKNPRLKDVSVDGFDRAPFSVHDTFVIMNASMRVSRRQDGEIVLDHPTLRLLTGASHVRLLRLGTCTSHENALDVGPEGELAGLVPFEVTTVDDVIDHFDELEDLLTNLPARRLAHTQEVLERANHRDTLPR
ncbi:MAG TPA: hypothetical protein VH370_01055 [Humisphaera sp.]|jgi:hypothetical protein|nr:hypothetical protein [Humisphaera sp.]